MPKNAFYEALERADLDAMMAVWSEDEEIVCVHPAGRASPARTQVRESWRQMFAGGAARARADRASRSRSPGMMLAVHSVHENITVRGRAARRGRRWSRPTSTCARAAGWRMIVHHASPAPGEPAAEPARRPSTPKILH